MSELLGAIIYFLIVILIFCFFMLYRNEWVYAQRLRLIDSDFDMYLRLKSYDEMLHKFWVWDVMEFVDST